ncbi:unnamed protein product [Diatraea saccharalis]|uniref:Fucosyltransferase n=1 Tax=Diatraea saccharalis TaxID=40085 RepID=A0A9N9QZJ4_9NEOP|nr:unnamed protein product [Diatraea saccharalis]
MGAGAYMPMSNLGAILLKDDVLINPARRIKRYLVYFHKAQKLFSRSRANTGQPNVKIDSSKKILSGCSVRNCHFVGDPKRLPQADVVVVSVDRNGDVPAATARAANQRWVFLALGSPLAINTSKIGEWANLFNWSMTYRSDSEVPIPYGRTLAFVTPAPGNVSVPQLVPHWRVKRRDVLAAALLSNCRVRRRMNYLNTLKRYIRVHYYGSCFYRHPKKECPRIGECGSIKRYLFYLAFENAECQQYITERVFQHALVDGAIPVIMGASYEQCATLLPPQSFLHVDNYPTIKHLAMHIKKIASDNDVLLSFHMWRRHFRVANETAWVGAADSRLCRLCEAINYNNLQHKVYDEDYLRHFLDPKRNCRN